MSTRLENKQTIINAFTSVKSAKQTINSACKELGLANNVNSLNLQTLANIICTHAISDLPYITSNISEAYTTRTTANGLNVVDNSYAEIQSIEGDTKALNGILYNSKVTSLVSKNSSGEVIDTLPLNLEVGKWQKIWKAQNLINLSSYQGQTIKGVTITKNSDNSLTLNGTSTASFTIFITLANIIKSGSYYGTLFWTYSLNISLWNSSTYVSSISNNGGILNLSSDIDKIGLYFDNGATFDNKIIKIMLVEGTTAPTVYLPYTTSSYLLDDNSEAKTFDGSETGWEYSSVYNYFYFQLTNAYLDSTAVTAISNILVVPYDNRSDDTTNILFDINSNNGTIQLRNTNLNSINALKTFLESNPITLHYQTATHTYTPLNINLSYTASNGGTETITNDNDVYGAIATISTDFIINNNTSINAITEEEEGE